jgi:hypothetical protein
MNTDVAIGGLEEILQLIERERLVCREGADDAEAHTLVDQVVEVGRSFGGAQPPDCAIARTPSTLSLGLIQV